MANMQYNPFYLMIIFAAKSKNAYKLHYILKTIMNKHLLALAGCLALGIAPAMATVTIEGNGTEYTSISAAMADAETGSTILVSESYLEETTINPGTKSITIKGVKGEGDNANDVVVSFKGQFVISLGDATCSLTVENLTFKNTLTAPNARNTFNIGRGSIYLKDVTIDGANVKSKDDGTPNYIISLDNSAGNIPNASFDNVKIINSTITGAPAEVVVRNSNLTLSGDTNLSIQLKGNNFIKSANGFTGKVTLVLDEARAVNSVVVQECTTPENFTLSGREGYVLQAKDGNLILAETPAVVNETTGTGYSTLNAALDEAANGQTVILNKDITLTSRCTLNGKAVTIKGATGKEKIIRGEGFLVYPFLINNADDNLTFENITLDGNNVEITAAMLQPANGASLTLKNVTVANCVTTNDRGLIDNNGTNPGTWHMDGVKFDNCTVPNQLVTANAAGNTIKGNNSFSLRVNNAFTVDAEGVNNETPVNVTVASPAVDKVVFTNCTDLNQFVCDNSGLKFAAKDGNLVLASQTSTGIDEITTEDNATAIWYNLQGERVQPGAPGLYIRRQGDKVSKVYIR